MAESTFSNCNLSNVLIQNVNLKDTRFTNVNLSNTIIGDAIMEHGEVCHCIMPNLHMHDINLNQVGDTSLLMERCKIENSTIRNCDLKNLKIESCDLEGATIDGIRVAELLECYQRNR